MKKKRKMDIAKERYERDRVRDEIEMDTEIEKKNYRGPIRERERIH